MQELFAFSMSRSIEEKKEFLHHVWLFNESISDTVQNRIARSIELVQVNEGDVVKVDDGLNLWVVCEGAIEWDWGRTYGPYEYFGDGFAIFEDENDDGYTATKATSLYKVPVSVLTDVPIIRWKLFESYRRRTLTA